MSKKEIEQWIGYFADEAVRGSEVGMDMILLHGGHGPLINNFFSPVFNHRMDKYSGSIENRAGFACELLDLLRSHEKLISQFYRRKDRAVPIWP
jgi:2,4-dienoyl-CoA reductase-like NADH-dependent reductase (Old Yellow Enzyme family)